MALVDYKCDKCGIVVEHEHDPAPALSWMCCGQPMRRIWSKPAISFKGSGFYVNDYKGGTAK